MSESQDGISPRSKKLQEESDLLDMEIAQQARDIEKKIGEYYNNISRENRELKQELKEAHGCLQKMSNFINNHTDLPLGPGNLADFERWKKLLIKLIAY